MMTYIGCRQRISLSTPLAFFFFLACFSILVECNEGCFASFSEQALSYSKHPCLRSETIKFKGLVIRTSSCIYMSAARRSNHHHHRPGNRRSKHQKLAPMEYEKSLRERGYNYIIGTDEVGRGSIAGPVLAVSCCILHPIQGVNDDELKLIDFVTDSKELTEQQRLHIYDQIHNEDTNNNKYYKYSISQRSSQDIQNTNILKATMECFQESIQSLILNENLPLDQTYAVVDGKSTPKLVNGPTPIPCRPYVSADKHIYTVSIASILAKVIRDNMMVDASKLYPEYGFDVNKGYSTKSHIEAIHKYGPCPLHRMSFKPLQYR